MISSKFPSAIASPPAPVSTLTTPESDPTLCLVMCYGVPIHINGGERTGGVDSALTLLFNSVEWGEEPIGCYASILERHIDNPYYDGSINPSYRTKPMDFEEFRSSSSNITQMSAPTFTIVRMVDNSHILAGGTYGMLYRGTLSNGAWSWESIPDKDKLFIASNINDISVLDPQHVWVSTDNGTVLCTPDAGHTWESVLIGIDNCKSHPSVKSASLYDSSGGWILIHGAANNYYVQSASYSSQWNLGSQITTLPTNFTPAAIAAASSQAFWLSGSGGIYYYNPNSQTPWSNVYSASSVRDIWVRNNLGWAIAANGQILHYDGTNWSQASGSPMLTAGQASSANLAVYDATHLVIAYGSQFQTFDGTSWVANTSGSASVAWAGGSDIATVRK